MRKKLTLPRLKKGIYIGVIRIFSRFVNDLGIMWIETNFERTHQVESVQDRWPPTRPRSRLGIPMVFPYSKTWSFYVFSTLILLWSYPLIYYLDYPKLLRTRNNHGIFQSITSVYYISSNNNHHFPSQSKHSIMYTTLISNLKVYESKWA